jgi:hypothetical protein
VAPGGALEQAQGPAAALREGRRVDRHPEGRRHLHGLRRGSGLLLPDGPRPRRTRDFGGAADEPQRHQAHRRVRRQAQGLHGLPPPRPGRRRAVLAEAPYNGANIDIGHWTATHNESPLPFIAKHHARIPHIHVKDRRLGTNGGENQPFGKGDTQVRQILQAIRDNKWNIRPIIEFEYKIPDGSDRVTEIKKCVAFCREALQG